MPKQSVRRQRAKAVRVVKKFRTTIAGLRYRLKEAREGADMSQSDVARLLDCSRSAVFAWEDGTNEPTAQRLRQLAQLYRVSHEYLANGDDAVTRDVVLLMPEKIADPAQRDECARLMTKVKRAQLWLLETDMMAGLNFRANDILVVEPAREATLNDIVIADYQDKGALIRIFFRPYLYALPLRSQPAPLIVDGRKITIIGIVRETLSRP